MGLPSIDAGRACEDRRAAVTDVPAFEQQLRNMAQAEGGPGWLAECAERDVYLALSRQLIDALAEWLEGIDEHKVLEVCAGGGRLAGALAGRGIRVVATDVRPAARHVEALAAHEALRRWRPRVVVGCFVPLDSGVDALVLGFPSVRHYLVLGARLDGTFGSDALWRRPGWKAAPVEAINRWMLTRHDVWTGDPHRPVLQHGEAWHFRRAGGADRSG